MCEAVTGSPRRRPAKASRRTVLTSWSRPGSAISIGALLGIHNLSGFPVVRSAGMGTVAAAQDPELAAAAARFFRVLGDPTRPAVTELLLERPRTVSEP